MKGNVDINVTRKVEAFCYIFSTNLIIVDTDPIESFYVELNFRNNKWLIYCSRNPHKSLITFMQ